MPLSREEVLHIALLPRLGLSEEEVERMRSELGSILEHFQVIGQVDTEKIPPTAQVIALENVFREDEVAPSLDAEKALANAPRPEKGCFRVKAVLE